MPSVDPLSGEAEHWMSHAAFVDYQVVAQSSRCPLSVVLYEAPTALSPGRWLKIGINRLRVSGHRGVRRGSDGSPVEAWIWPRSAMSIIDGPTVDLAGSSVLALPDEGESPENENDNWVVVDKLLGSKRSTLDDDPRPSIGPAPQGEMEERGAALKVLCDRLQMPQVPRYSVLRSGLAGVDLWDTLELVTFGIRVFLIADTLPEDFEKNAELRPFLESRLLEVAEAAGADATGRWIIDGCGLGGDQELETIMDAADAHGGINVLQYRIVHADAGADVQVVAGAGTGKTETMTERIMFLLATSQPADTERKDGEQNPRDLRMDEIVLVTFTKEAAKQMRDRIARVLMLRQRLCRRNVLPALAWLMQLGSAQISTIHSYAKQVTREGAAVVGFGPAVTVSQLTLEFREAFRRAISPFFTAAVRKFGARDKLGAEVPPIHEWTRHALEIWTTMDNAGISMLDLQNLGPADFDIDWGMPRTGTIDEAMTEALPEVFRRVSEEFAAICRQHQSIPTSQLVTVALQCLQSEDSPMVRHPRYLFVDEFQDTDEQQMDFILAVRQKLDARLFVVGDVKQGIYRFRGAQGNAFSQLAAKWRSTGLPSISVHRLVRNFRSGGKLLDSVHPFFAAWGSSPAGARLLEYGPDDRLLVARSKRGRGVPLSIRTLKKAFIFDQEAASQVAKWRGPKNNPSTDSIAVLCRHNWQARKVQQAVRGLGYSCDLAAKGSFYQSPAVREMRALLEAVNNPNDDAALLEIAETRWANGILSGTEPFGVVDSGVEGDPWAEPVGGLVPWRDRWRTIPTGSFDRRDLEFLRRRVISLRAMLGNMALLGWLTVLTGHFAPQNVSQSTAEDPAELKRYGRCLTHLMSCLDEEFGNTPVTLAETLFWLTLQIATNESEDEPFDAEDSEGATVAITVHKAKGLQFQRVLIPHTWMSWGPPDTARTVATLLRNASQPAIVWKWKGTSNSDKLRHHNQDPASTAWRALWDADNLETAKEEARLLYVAMTRAKDELVIYVEGKGTETTWESLLNMEDRS